MNREKLSYVLSTTRNNGNKSQEYMAEKLNVTRQTIANWESGKTLPDVYQTLEWFDALNVNSTPYFLQFINKETLDGISADNDNNEIREALIDLVSKLPSNYVRALLYLLFGSYGGDTESMINLAIAHAHLPLQYRIISASNVLQMYDICNTCNTLKDTGHIMPNIELVNVAIEKAKQAHFDSKDGYQIKY